MKFDRFNEVTKKRIDACLKTMTGKSEEYSTEQDKLHNFKVAAQLQNCTPITALAGMMAKHTVSVYDLVERQENGLVVTKEMWDEKIGDHINYLLLLDALITEKFDEETEGASCSATPAVNVLSLIEYMKDETDRLDKWADNIKNCSSEDTYKAGYEHGKCAGARELARTISLYLAIDKE